MVRSENGAVRFFAAAAINMFLIIAVGSGIVAALTSTIA